MTILMQINKNMLLTYTFIVINYNISRTDSCVYGNQLCHAHSIFIQSILFFKLFDSLDDCTECGVNILVDCLALVSYINQLIVLQKSPFILSQYTTKTNFNFRVNALQIHNSCINELT